MDLYNKFNKPPASGTEKQPEDGIRKALERIFNGLKTLNSQNCSIKEDTTALRKIIKDYYVLDAHNTVGVMMRDKLPWDVTPKECFLLQKAGYSVSEVQFLTGYDVETLKKKTQQHLKNSGMT